MAIRFTARHMTGGAEHMHIASLKWVEDGDPEVKGSTTETLVDWVRNQHGQGYVFDSAGDMTYVQVVDAEPSYLRTAKDGVWTDNLLALPTY
jgi:hypothetical protein